MRLNIVIIINIFLILEHFKDMSEWAPAWNNLSTDQKAFYKERAKEVQVTDKAKAAKAKLKKIVGELSNIF